MASTLQSTASILPDVSSTWVNRYLAILGLERREPTFEALTEITRAHLQVIHFENLTSLLRAAELSGEPAPPMDPEAMLAAWERRAGGGVCFEIASMFHLLVEGLGYRSFVAPGNIGAPGGHLSVVIEIDGSRYLADLGNGGPFFEPIQLDREVEVHHAGLGFRFRPGDEPDTWLQERFIHGSWESFCTYTLRPIDPELRRDAYQRHHVTGHSWVTGEPRVVRCDANAVTRLTELQFETYTSEGKRVEPVRDRAHLLQLSAELFDLPNLPWDEAIAAHRRLVVAANPG